MFKRFREWFFSLLFLVLPQARPARACPPVSRPLVMAKKVPKKWIRNPSDELAIEQGCYFDESAGLRVIAFIERFCRQSKGRWAGQTLKLLPWQKDFLMRLFGWKLPSGLRRYRRSYVEVAKKNGKSTLLSGLVLALMLIDGEGAPEIYLNACDRAQASMIFDESARMVRSSPDLIKRLTVLESKSRIVWKDGNGVIRANSADAPNKDGLNPSTIVFDELHRQPDRALWEVFEYAAAARLQPLTLSITTAGEDSEGVWHEQRVYSEQVNAGLIQDITHLGVVYRALETDDIDDPRTWLKANPSLGETISFEDFNRELTEAKQFPAKLANFKRLRLNIIARESAYLFTHEQWAACGPEDGKPRKFDFAAMRGKPCYLGFDLSSTTDLTAIVAIWGDFESGFDLYPWFYLPEENIVQLENRDGQRYQALAKEGYITLTPGPVVDYAFLRREFNLLNLDHKIVKILGDPHMAVQLITELVEGDGLPVEAIRQGFISLNAPTKELQRLVIAKKLRHHNHPLLKWMAMNAITECDAAGNLKISKKKTRLKIDGIAATINALAGAISDTESSQESVYETRGFFIL